MISRKRLFVYFKKSFSVVLSLVMMLSVCAVSGVSLSVSAATKAGENGAIFGQGQYIYFNCKNATNWKDAGAVTKCLMYNQWPNNGDPVDSIDMQQMRNDSNLFRCFMLANDVKYIKIQRYSPSGEYWGEVTNNGSSVFSVDSNDRDNNPAPTGGNSNCLYVNNSSFSTASWGTATDPDTTITKGTYVTKTATDSSTMRASNLDLVKGTFYDYYNNDEMRNGWITGLDGSERSYKDREPFTFFNNAVANYARLNSSWLRPLYFGDFNRSNNNFWKDGYQGAGVSDFYKYVSRANNSAATSTGLNGAVSGLVDKNLSNGNITSGNVALPYFSESFLSQGYGAVVKSNFPFRQESRNNDTYYVYNSTGGRDNFYFTNPTGTPVANYYENQNSINDAASGFGNPSNGKGLFPFDTPNTDAKDFGFGVKLEIPFTIPTNGKTLNGNDVVFNFSGDDDLWVFIDDVLVLDMGGAHKMATGSLNFTKKTATVNSLDTTFGSPSSTIDVKWGAAHVMKVFYMERGMAESNMKIEYNFDPIENLLTTSKTVNTSNLNEGLKTALENNSKFQIQNKDLTTDTNLANRDYTIGNQTGKTSSTGTYDIKHGQTASFSGIVDSQLEANEKVGDKLSVVENKSGNINYQTSYVVRDMANDVEIKRGNDETATFDFINSVTKNARDYAYYDVAFTNTPDVSKLEVSKTAYDKDGTTPISDTDFGFKVGVDLDGGTNYKYYNLEYTVNGTKMTASSGNFTLRGGQKAVFNGIPVGATYVVTESGSSDYTIESPASGKVSGTITSSGGTAAFVNKKINKDPATVTLAANKKLDNQIPNVNDFEFTLKEVTSSGALVQELPSAHNNGGNVTFAPIKYEYEEEPTQPATQPPTQAPTQPATEAPTQAPTQPTTAPPVTNNSRVYVKTADGVAPNIYAWNSNGTLTSSWPGNRPTQKSGDYWYIELNTTATYNVVVSKNGNDGVKTQDIENLSKDTYITITNSSDFWNNTTYETGKARSTYSLKANASKAVSSVGAKTIEYHYYEIAEKAGTDTAYTYDGSKFYAAVQVNYQTTPISATAKYYKTLSNAVNGTNEIQASQVVFNNYHKGSVTVVKKNQADNKLPNAEFTLYRVNSDGDTNFADVVNSLKTGANGEVKFDNLAIFKDNNSSNTPQWYAIKETKAPDGYNVNNTVTYFTLPVTDDSDNPHYDITYTYTDGAVVMPNTSGNGAVVWYLIGFGIVGTGAMLALAYFMYDNVQRKKRRARYRTK